MTKRTTVKDSRERGVEEMMKINKLEIENVKRVKAIVDGSPKHVYVCTRCLRSGKVTRAV